jgi:hypothetical protein
MGALRRRMAAVVTLLAVMAVVAPRAAADELSAARAQWKPDVFPISFWCGPPPEFVNLEQYQRIKDAHFTHIMPSCTGGGSPEHNRTILDIAQKTGLKVFIHDSRMPVGVPDEQSKQRVRIISNTYKDHPAMAGYHVVDEPGAGLFPALGQTAAALREADPEHPAYINLFPNYAPLSALGTPSYEEHVRRFIETVKPSIVSYDHYHFLNGPDRSGFFNNLEIVRRLSLQHNLHFWQIVLLIDHHGAYRRPSEAEKRWLAMHTLAFGGKGLMWFTYWRPWDDPQWGEAMINTDGTPTAQYEETKRINKDVQTLGKYLLHATSTQAFEYGQPGDHSNIIGGDMVRFDGPHITVGIFQHDATRYVMLVNRDYQHAANGHAYILAGGAQLEMLNKVEDTWQPATATPFEGGYVTLQYNLAAGDGELYRLSP